MRIGDADIRSPDARGLSTADIRAARTAFQQELGAALVKAGYPATAEPTRVNLIGIVAILLVFLVAATAMYGPVAACLVELFPAHIRYTALSFPYHVGTGWFGGLMPAIAFAIMTATGDIYAGLWYPVVITAIAFVIMLAFLPETKGRSIDA